MIETNLQLSDDQRKDWLRRFGVLPVDPVGYAWNKCFGEEALIPKSIRCNTLMDLYASRMRESNRVGGRIAAKRFAKVSA